MPIKKSMDRDEESMNFINEPETLKEGGEMITDKKEEANGEEEAMNVTMNSEQDSLGLDFKYAE